MGRLTSREFWSDLGMTITGFLLGLFAHQEERDEDYGWPGMPEEPPRRGFGEWAFEAMIGFVNTSLKTSHWIANHGLVMLATTLLIAVILVLVVLSAYQQGTSGQSPWFPAY